MVWCGASARRIVERSWSPLSTIQHGSYQSCPAHWCAIWQRCALSTPAPFHVIASSIARPRPCGRVSYQDEQFITTWRAQKLDGDRYQPTGILPGSRSCLLITAPVWLNVLCRLFSRGTVGGESGDSSVTDPSPTVLQSKH